MEKAQASTGWQAELAKPAHTPESEEYGVSSIVFRAQRPFHPQRLDRILAGFAAVNGHRVRLKTKTTEVRCVT